MLAGSGAKAGTLEQMALEPYKAPAAPSAKDWPREKLLRFLRELADFVEKNHLVTDPQRKTCGMVYEFWKDGKKMQEFGLDSMRDGAWWMSALATAQRADKTGDWLARAQKFTAPFYTNLLNHSDRLFPRMQPMEEDLKHWPAPVKGWAPRGWDDGLGIDRKTGKPLPDWYFTNSNHLSQDLADALMNVWLSTRDPDIAEALGHLRDYKRDCFGPIQGIEIAASVSEASAAGFLGFKFPDFTPAAMAPYYTGLYEQRPARLCAYDDETAWLYHQGAAAAQVCGEFPRGLAGYIIARAYGSIAATELYYDHPCFCYGPWPFDLQKPPGFAEGKGRFEEYASTSKDIVGSRGVEMAWIAAGILPELKAAPGLWSGALRRYPGESVVRMVNDPPVTDGIMDEVYSQSGGVGDLTPVPQGEPTVGAAVHLVSDPKNLHLFIQCSALELALTIQPATPQMGEAHFGKILIGKDGTINATNEKGERLLFVSAFVAGPPWSAELRIPYTVVPGQAPWINGVDFGRYKVTVDGSPAGTVVIASDASRIRKRLEDTVLGNIDYWHRVWLEAGFIPSGWHSSTTAAGAWEISDAGGYAHLMNAIALWLIYQDGKQEWQVIRNEFPSDPDPAPGLPESVLKAQGL